MTRHPRIRPAVYVAIAAILLAGVLLALKQARRAGSDAVHPSDAVDQRIGREVEAALVQELQSLSGDDDIVRRYGRFSHLTGSGISRPRYAWQLVQRLDYGATAHFEKAKAAIFIGVTVGPLVKITRLEMTPSEQWRRDNPATAGELKVIDGEIWMVWADGRTRGDLSGWASHPDYVND